MAMMMSVPGNSGSAINASPSWLLLQQQIAMLQSQFLIAGVQGAGVAAQQLQQVNQNAAALERQLVAAGAGKGTRVGMLFPNSVTWIEVFLAATRIGAQAYRLTWFETTVSCTRHWRRTIPERPKQQPGRSANSLT